MEELLDGLLDELAATEELLGDMLDELATTEELLGLTIVIVPVQETFWLTLLQIAVTVVLEIGCTPSLIGRSKKFVPQER